MHGLFALLGLLPRGGLRYEAFWPPSTPDEEQPTSGTVVRADAADSYWKITGGPPGDGLGAVLDSYAVRAGAAARRRRRTAAWSVPC